MFTKDSIASAKENLLGVLFVGFAILAGPGNDVYAERGPFHLPLKKTERTGSE